MSHYSGHVSPQNVAKPPSARVAFMGISLFAVGYLGFFNYLNKRHGRRLLNDTSDNKISSWESRMVQRSSPMSEFANTPTLPASRVQLRATPIIPASEHNARHRTISSDRANGINSDHKNANQQPTAQRDGTNGYVYTKRVDMNGDGVGERKKAPGIRARVGAAVEGLKEDVVTTTEGVKEKVVDMFGEKN